MLRRLLESVTRVRSVFSRIDQGIVEFQLKAGLRCIPGCGRCCAEAEVHTTVLEMLPAAHEILYQAQADLWLHRIENQNPARRCVLFQPDILPEAAGHCALYDHRPSICRLFGFAAVRSRLGEKMMAVCRQVKSSNPEAAARAIRLQDEALCFPEIGSQIFAQDPVLGGRLIPINQALHEALLCMGLHMQVSRSETLGNTTAA